MNKHKALCVGGPWNGRWINYSRWRLREKVKVLDDNFFDFSSARRKNPVRYDKDYFHWEFYDAMLVRNGSREWVVFRHESLNESQALSAAMEKISQPANRQAILDT